MSRPHRPCKRLPVLHTTIPVWHRLNWVLVASLWNLRSVHTMTSPPKVNLLDLASACVACAEAASRAIKIIAEPNHHDTMMMDSLKNTRLKDDGSFVTDADFAAQGIIVQAIRSISEDVRIVGEESAEEMAEHTGKHGYIDPSIFKRTQDEIRLRYHKTTIQTAMPLAQGVSASDNDANDDVVSRLTDPNECIVDAHRVGVVVDPLDGTKSYAQGDYDAVSILISIILDNQPHFGVIGKPFGYPEGANLTSVLDRSCVIVYGGLLLHGVYIAGGKEITPSPLAYNVDDDLPRAVISSSRSLGVVHDFCLHLADQKLIHREPLHISGAGEKSLRLILQVNNEALWFFPKKGTSLWDVAAPDAILRSLGGKLTDRHGNLMDYTKKREDAENMEGVVACIDAELHSKCIALYSQGDWASRV